MRLSTKYIVQTLVRSMDCPCLYFVHSTCLIFKRYCSFVLCVFKLRCWCTCEAWRWCGCCFIFLLFEADIKVAVWQLHATLTYLCAEDLSSPFWSWMLWWSDAVWFWHFRERSPHEESTASAAKLYNLSRKLLCVGMFLCVWSLLLSCAWFLCVAVLLFCSV